MGEALEGHAVTVVDELRHRRGEIENFGHFVLRCPSLRSSHAIASVHVVNTMFVYEPTKHRPTGPEDRTVPQFGQRKGARNKPSGGTSSDKVNAGARSKAPAARSSRQSFPDGSS